MKPMRAKKVLFGSCCCVFGLFLAAGAWAAQTIKIYDQPDISGAPYRIAYEEGYFKEEGLDVEFVRGKNYPEGVMLLIQGAVDVIEGVVFPGILNSAADGKMVRLVAGTTVYAKGSRFIGIAVVKKAAGPEDIPSLVKGLASKKIALANVGGIVNFILEHLFEKYNVPLDKENLVTLTYPFVIVGMENGSIDAGFLAEPFVTLLKKKRDFSLIAFSDVFPESQAAFLIFGPNMYQKKPEVGVRFLRAYLKGYRQYLEGKTKRNVEIMKKYTGLEEGLLEEMDWPVLVPEGILNKESLQLLHDYQEWCLNKKFAVKRADLEKLVDPVFLREAMASRQDTP